MDEASSLAVQIVAAEMRDDWALVDLLRPNLRVANRQRRPAGLKPIRATQAWYFARTAPPPET